MNSRIYFGNQAAGPSVDRTAFELRTLTPGEITAQALNLANAPVDSSVITAFVAGGSTFLPGVDFTLTGTLVDFSISPYQPLLVAGDKIQFIYQKA